MHRDELHVAKIKNYKHMKLIQLIFLLAAFSFSGLLGQTLYVAETVTENGEPIGAFNYWKIKPWGKSLFIILDNEGNEINDNIIYLFVDKKNDESYAPFDSKAVTIESSATWVSYNYKFTESGEYEIYFINTSQEKLASLKISIESEEHAYTEAATRSRYYDNSKIIFCAKVLFGGTTLGVRNRTAFQESSGLIYLKLENYAPLKTSIILVDVWRKKNRTFEYDEFIESKKYRVDPEWPDTFFKYQFSETGQYKFAIYNENEVQIVSGYFTIY